MTRTDLALMVLLVIMVTAGIVWAMVGDWDVPDFRGAEYEFVEPTCEDAPHLCGTPVTVR